MPCEAIEVGPQRSKKSVPNPRKSVRQAAFCLLLAAGIIAAAGCFAAVLVGYSQPGKASQITPLIDGRDFRAALDQWVALDQARVELETAEAAIRSLDANIVPQKSVIAQRRADIAEAQALARDDRTRYQTHDYGTMQRAEHAERASQKTSAQLQLALVAAENKIEVLVTERVKAEAERDRSQANLHEAALKLAYTKCEIAELDDDVMRNSAQ